MALTLRISGSLEVKQVKLNLAKYFLFSSPKLVWNKFRFLLGENQEKKSIDNIYGNILPVFFCDHLEKIEFPDLTDILSKWWYHVVFGPI